MGIKCSLLGHDFGEATVERDREEQGSEVVITIREIQTCSRCGEAKVVSENKEVTALETPDDVTVDDAEESTEGEPDREPEPAESDAADADDQEAEGAAVVEAESGDADDSGPSASTGTDSVTESAPPMTDDAEILDDDDDREPGEWPQSEDEADEAADDAEFDQYSYGSEDEDDAPAAEGDDAEFIDADDEEPEPRTNAWPSEDDEQDREPTGPGAITVPEGEFVCEACGFSTPVEKSSLRAGDFCPECHDGTLVQVREDERRNG